jgi:WD domain, G-beta repeat
MICVRLAVAALALSPLLPAPLAAAEPTPVATLRLPGGGESAGRVWVGFDPAARYLAAYRIPTDVGAREIGWSRYHSPQRIPGAEARLTVWGAARWELVHDAAVGAAFADPEVGWPAAFLPSGSHLVYLTAGGLGAHPLGAARGAVKPDAPAAGRGRRPAASGLWAGPAGEDLKRVAANGDWTVVAVDATDPDKPGGFAGRREYRLGAKASALALSPDQSRLAWAEEPPDFDQVVTVHVLDLGTGRAVRLKTAGPANSLSRLAFSPDGKALAAGSYDGSVRLWDVGAGKETAVYRGPLFTVGSLAFSPDGAVLAYGTFESKGGGNVWLVSARDGSHLAAWSADRGGVFCVAFDAKGERLAVVGGEQVVKVYDLRPVLKK